MKAQFSVSGIDLKNNSVTVTSNRKKETVLLSKHEQIAGWTFMGTCEYQAEVLAIFENFREIESPVVFITEKGVYAELNKSAASTKGDPDKLYGGRTLSEVFGSDHSLHFHFHKKHRDLLGEEVLSGTADPTFEEVAAYLPPLRLQTFIGTPYTLEKQVFAYGGQSDYLDRGRNIAEIQAARNNHTVLEGLVGDYLPVLRFVLPVNGQRYWEEIVFAREDPERLWKQPVWYRLLLVENGQILSADYYYNSIPFPKLRGPEPGRFYQELLRVQKVWEERLQPAMEIRVPEERIAKFCKHSLVREMITRSRLHPRYGFIDGYKQHGCGWLVIDCVQPTFNSAVSAHLEWGMFDIAKDYLNDYYEKYVYEDGSLETMGAEIPGYGRMLANLAQYYHYTGDAELLFKFRSKILAIIHILLDLRKDSKAIPAEDPRHGVLHGWVENDAHMFSDPDALMMPHFSNSTEVWRGFRDLGSVLREVGAANNDKTFVSTGSTLLAEAAAIEADLHVAIERSLHRESNPPFLANYAGGKEPWQWLDGRVYSTMMASGVLNASEVAIVSQQQNRILGLFRGWSEGGKGMLGFDVHGYPYGLLQHDMIRDFLLFYYANMAHIHSRGTWTALELANADGTQETPYCPPAQMTIPLNTRWMLVFEDPREEILWLTRGTPRAWLSDGQTIAVENAPTRWGKISFELNSKLGSGIIQGTLHFGRQAGLPVTKVKFRTPGEKTIRRIEVNGQPWSDVDAAAGLLTLHSLSQSTVHFTVYFE